MMAAWKTPCDMLMELSEIEADNIKIMRKEREFKEERDKKKEKSARRLSIPEIHKPLPFDTRFVKIKQIPDRQP